LTRRGETLPWRGGAPDGRKAARILHGSAVAVPLEIASWSGIAVHRRASKAAALHRRSEIISRRRVSAGGGIEGRAAEAVGLQITARRGVPARGSRLEIAARRRITARGACLEIASRRGISPAAIIEAAPLPR